MFLIDQLILLAAVLILLGIFSSKISARLGLPMLVLFLLVGMLAGEDGIGRIAFDNPQAAHALGTLALALILFDGGLQTPLKSIKQVWKPASMLATFGVLGTAVITGAAASYILDISLLTGMLLGAIVGSTDAAAVFSLLRNAGIHLNPRLKSTLEIESASNDPMAIFLTVGLLEILVNDMQPGWPLLQLFVMQMGVGALVGIAVGYAVLKVINRIHLQASGLYPVLVTAAGLLSFGVAANTGGSGFLAIFICGVLIGNTQFAFQRTTFLFHDGLAWLSQITMFVVLGLLINPSSLLDVWWQGILIAAVLVFLARPITIVPILTLFGFNRREMTLVSWVGLRGSVPIILAIFPLMFGLADAELIFNVVFFVVLISATLQGSTLAWVARRLKLIEQPTAQAPVTLEITALGDVDAEIVEYSLSENSRAAYRRLSRMALPESVVVAMISRGDKVIPPRGSTILHPGDHLFVVLHVDYKHFVEQAFADKGFQLARPIGELRMKGATKLSDIDWCYGYGVALNQGRDDLTLEALCIAQLGDNVADQAEFEFAERHFQIVEMVGDRIVTVRIKPLPSVSSAE
ncbi:potassium/proton antiporter [Alishewanella sp. 16-MA]|uniref:Potassium/proton antiporter n=1 Tax=Alishewanella maricola TaxID=2795740 RepID=A0ABS8C753_9ALTE|nr:MULTISPECIES: potassium/proton antiporter [Gammaproteobacteria]MCB5228162.1 potassium/proton antiporter [Alishewanella maricola]MCC5451761.1 potassium/proton antiporter [Rheinheimera sp. UJ51]MCF4009632.1 potassium/proton antiporter [Rheinheimera sp. UJ63]